MAMRIRVAGTVCAAAVALLLGASPAFAHYCTNTNKKQGAGSIGTYNVVSEAFTPAKRGGGFITITDGTWSYDVFVHQTLPEGALASGPGDDDMCDGRGVDSALDCLGIPHEQ